MRATMELSKMTPYRSEPLTMKGDEMRNALVVVLSVLLAASFFGCATLSGNDKAKLEEVKACGLSVPHEELKSPGAAGALNILPGFGNFYLASGTDEGSQWAIGFVNLLTWPISVVWGIPEAAIDADVINKKNSVYYYTYKQGKDELKTCQVKLEKDKMPESETITSNKSTTKQVAMTKKCPMCAEEIAQDAIKCKHCGSIIANKAE